MKDYGKGKIYKIVCNKTNLIYIGSTREPTLARRLAKHVSSYKSYLKTLERKKYMTSYKIIENNDYDIVLIEDFPCNTKDQLHRRERFYIESIKCVNKIVPTRTHKEYANEYQKSYYHNNKDIIKEKARLYHEKNKEHIKDRQKENYEKNKDNISSHNRDKFKIKYTCQCGSTYASFRKAIHEKTSKHQVYLQSQEEGV